MSLCWSHRSYCRFCHALTIHFYKMATPLGANTVAVMRVHCGKELVPQYLVLSKCSKIYRCITCTCNILNNNFSCKKNPQKTP